MRQIVLDTETTGLEPQQGHRVIEIGCVEILRRRVTGSDYHHYLQPDRIIDEGALAVHGITNEFLADKPRMQDIIESFLDYVRGAELIIHNAPFDVGFLNHELARLGEHWGRIEDHCSIVDTLEMARRQFPGQRNNLDALCRRFEIDNSHRELHGALLDARILADVYLAMTGGQTSLVLGDTGESDVSEQHHAPVLLQRSAALRVITADADELAAHERVLDAVTKASGGKTVWRRVAADAGPA